MKTRISRDLNEVAQLDRFQMTNEIFSRLIEVLVNGLQSFWSNGLNSNQRPFDVGPLHCNEELWILRGFHRDLGKEIHVSRQIGEPIHEFESLIANAS